MVLLHWQKVGLCALQSAPVAPCGQLRPEPERTAWKSSSGADGPPSSPPRAGQGLQPQSQAVSPEAALALLGRCPPQ